MNFRLHVLIFCAFFPLALHAQDYSVHIQSGAFTPAANGVEIGRPSPTEIVGGKYYRCIQFYAIPTDAEKTALAAAGITLHDYLPVNTYTAAIPAGTNLALLPARAKIRAIFPMGAARKLSAELAQKKFPAHALRAGGKIELTLIQQPGLSAAEVVAMLQRDGISVLGTVEVAGAHKIVVPIAALHSVAYLPYVAFLEPAEPLPTPDNQGGRTSHRSNTINTDYGNGLKFDGSGVTVALNDDGFIGPHIDYTGRIGAQYIGTSTGDHGDHCAGTIFGAGNRIPTARGMASGAILRVYDAITGTILSYQAFDSIYQHYNNLGVRITSTSYSDGTNAGYTNRARLMDIQTTDLPELIHVFSAGNAGTSSSSYGAGAGWANITGGHKAAKNVIAVGNLDSLDALNSSSSRGPAHDGRIKPEICAVGTNVQSTIAGNIYDNYTGTSMACPGVSGTLAQLYQAWKSMNGGANPKSALIKAAVLNTADDIGNPGPDFRHGYGRINARRAYALLQAQQFFHDSVSQGGAKTHSITVPAGTSEVRVMIYWHDYRATNGSTKALVNDLHMTLTTPASTTVLPWKLNRAPNATALNQPAFQGVDSLNNMEQVTIPTPAAGTYTITVTGATVPMGPQSYFVVYEFVQPGVTLTYPIGGESLVPGVPETIRWDAYGNAGTFAVEYSSDSGASWTTLAGSVAATQRHYNWMPPAAPTGRGMIRVTRGASSDASDAAFTVIGVPTNLTVNWVCMDSMQVSYSAVPGASRYVVRVLGAAYMDSVASSTTTTCVVRGINTMQANWYSVQALASNGGKGRRATAQIAQAVPFNCTVVNDLTVLSVQTPAASISQCTGGSTTDSVRVTLRNLGLSNFSNVSLFYSLNGGPAVSAVFAGSIPAGALRNFTFPAPLTLTGGGTYTLKIWAQHPADAVPANDTLTRTITVAQSPLVALPLTMNFESFSLCDTSANCGATVCTLGAGWSNAAGVDSIDWRVWSGPTPSWTQTAGATGPSVDYNPGTAAGRYAYLEANGCFQKTAHLLSPCINLAGVSAADLRFAYHMLGAGTGALHVDVLSEGVWTMDVATPIAGNQGAGWKVANVSLPAQLMGKVINLRFRGVTGSSLESDIALDDISVFDPAGVGQAPSSLAVDIFPNPSAGSFSLTMAGVKGSVELFVTDMNGRELERRAVEEKAGVVTTTVQLRNSAAGVYFLTIRSAEGVLVRKLVKL